MRAQGEFFERSTRKIQGSRFNGRPSVSKTESGGSNPSSPASFVGGAVAGASGNKIRDENVLGLRRSAKMAQAAKTNRDEAEHRVSGFSLLEPIGKLAEYPRRLRSFLHDVRIEMRHVNWPSGSDVVSTTVVVTVTVAFFGLFFFVVDSGIGEMIQRVLKYFQQ